MNAVVLASGGLDSTVTAAVAKHDGCDLHLLTISYGQRHHLEVDRAQRIGQALRVVSHAVVAVDLRTIADSVLIRPRLVPKDRSAADRRSGIPDTYVPGRNTIFLSLAATYAETINAPRIYFGANIVDYSGYPDCRPDYLRAFEQILRVGTRAGVEGQAIEICAPLLTMSKADIIRLGLSLQAPIHLTHSCYDPTREGRPCGRCDSCLIRQEGFQEVGLPDPAIM